MAVGLAELLLLLALGVPMGPSLTHSQPMLWMASHLTRGAGPMGGLMLMTGRMAPTTASGPVGIVPPPPPPAPAP